MELQIRFEALILGAMSVSGSLSVDACSFILPFAPNMTTPLHQTGQKYQLTEVHNTVYMCIFEWDGTQVFKWDDEDGRKETRYPKLAMAMFAEAYSRAAAAAVANWEMDVHVDAAEMSHLKYLQRMMLTRYAASCNCYRNL